MKGKLQTAVNILSLILLIVCFVRIGRLQNEITRLRNDVNNSQSMLQSSINSISSNVRYEMEQASNLLSDSSWNTGGLDIENKTATLYCYVVPKVYNPEKTTATIIHNGNEIPMTLENGRYVAEFAVPLFDACTIENVQFIEDGTIRTQQLNWVLNPRYDMIPTAYVNYSGSSSQNYKKEDITRSYQGAVEIDFEHKSFAGEIKDVEIVLLLNDKEQWSCKPTLEEIYKDDYIAHYMADIEYSFNIKRGDSIKMYADIVDENGWRYRSTLEDVTISEKGNPIHNSKHYHAEAEIYDADGNLLFDPYENQ